MQHARLLCPSLSPRVCPDSCLLSQWCHPTISSSAASFSFCLPSFPALRYFSMSCLFTSGGQSIGALASASVLLLQEGGSLPGPETRLWSNTQKWVVQGDTCADKARDFIGEGPPGGEQEGQGTQENCSATWPAVSGFMVMGLVSGLSLANHLTQSPSRWYTPYLAKMDASEKGSGKWSDTLCLLLIFPKLFWLVIAY